MGESYQILFGSGLVRHADSIGPLGLLLLINMNDLESVKPTRELIYPNCAISWQAVSLTPLPQGEQIV